jgi:hypothetical protein
LLLLQRMTAGGSYGVVREGLLVKSLAVRRAGDTRGGGGSTCKGPGAGRSLEGRAREAGAEDAGEGRELGAERGPGGDMADRSEGLLYPKHGRSLRSSWDAVPSVAEKQRSQFCP